VRVSAQIDGLRIRRFVSVGAVASVVDGGVLLGLHHAGVNVIAANGAALLAAALVSYAGHRRFTLGDDRHDRWIRQPPVFVVVALSAALVDMAIVITASRWPLAVAKAVAMLAAAILRLFAHRLVLFRVVRRGQSEPTRFVPAPGEVRLSVVIPAFREGKRIGASVREVRRELAELERAGDLEIVVVDDGSPDDTTAEAHAAGADQVITFPKNRGKGAAVRTGAQKARGRTVAFIDADLSYPPAQLMSFLAAIEAGYDVAIGNRHHCDTMIHQRQSPTRSFGSRIVNMASSLLLLGNYRDTQCGCKAFRSDALPQVVTCGQIDRFGFDIEVLYLVERRGLSLVELPVELVPSPSTTVRAVRDGIGIIFDILRVRGHEQKGAYR